MRHIDEHDDVDPQFARLMVGLSQAFTTSKPLADLQIKLWARALDDLTLEQVAAGCVAAVKECKWFPTIAEVRAFVVPTADDAALIAWTGLGQAAGSVGAYQALEVEDGAAAEALEAVFGSWPAFCDQARDSDAGWGARRQEFLAAYRAARRGPGGARRLMGLCDPGPVAQEALARTWVGRLAATGRVTVERATAALPAPPDQRQIADGADPSEETP